MMLTPNESGRVPENSGSPMRNLTRFTGPVWNNFPLVLFVLAIVLASFGYGGLVGKYRLFPYTIIADGVKTGRYLLSSDPEATDDGKFAEFADIPLGVASRARIEFVAGNGLQDPVLWYGGRFQFLDLCPDAGCLAVEYTTTGEVAHAWPFRPHELEKVGVEYEEYPYELAIDHSFVRDAYPIGIERYPNGDLLVTFQMEGTAHPFGGGVARVGSDGHPVWYRRDYSHHWPQLLDDGTALVPGTRIGEESITFELPGGEVTTVRCDTGDPYLDTVNVVDGGGKLLKSIDLVEALASSKFAPVLHQTSDPCDPLHLNSIHQLGDDAGGAHGIAPGDLVVSLRNLSAFAILDGETGRLKLLVRGGFFRQHNVQHLEGSTFLMFDNLGHDDVGGPSRLLMVDVSDGRETTIFPNDSTSEALGSLFSDSRGNIDISPDRKRAIVAFSNAGVAVEVRISDGVVLSVFTSLHDVSGLEQFSEERTAMAGIFLLQGIDYVKPQGE